MAVDGERIYRCRQCGELRTVFGVRFNRQANNTDVCPFCGEMSPGVEETLRLYIRKGVAPSESHADEEPDRVIDGVELYVTTRGEASAAVEWEEWADLMGREE